MIKKEYLIFVMAVLFGLMLPMMSAVKPTSNIITTNSGFIIEVTVKDYLRTGIDHEFEVHVFNLTNGVPIISGISCYMHLYSIDGNHIYIGEDNTVDNLFDYSFNLDGGNFSTRGEYQAKFQCNDSINGGGQEIFFIVNNYGEELTQGISLNFNFGMIFLMILFLLALIGIFQFENFSGKLACYWVAHVLFVVGTFSVWQFNEGYSIAFTGLAGIFKILFYVSITAFFPMLILSVVWIFYIHLMNDDIKKMMDRGMDESEAYERAKKNRRNRR